MLSDPPRTDRRTFLHRGAMAAAGTLIVPRAGAAAGAGAFPIRTADVREHRGAPTLHINGAPHAGLALFYGVVAGGEVEMRAFSAAGIDVFSGVFGLANWLREDGTLDFTALKSRLDYAIGANPRALILPRVGLDLTNAPEWWVRRFAGERQVHLRAATGERLEYRSPFSSTRWRETLAAALHEYVVYCETHYGRHIVGYHLGAGATGEWSYSWDPTVISDFSAAQRAAFGRWLRARYRDDVARLRAAWRDSNADFATAEIPRERGKTADDRVLFDPQTEQATIDYRRFHSEAVAEAAVFFCGTAKRALARLGRSKVVGIFYGYHFKNMNRAGAFTNTGHFAQDAVLRSPDVDFIAAPYDYNGREPGHAYSAQLLAGTVRLHGKLYYCEEDTYTFRAKRVANRSWCPDRETTVGVFRRNLLGILRDNGAAWYMDCGANSPEAWRAHGIGWYRDAGLMRNFAQMQRFAERRLGRTSLEPTAQIAFVLGEHATDYLRQDEALIDALIFKQKLELAAVGAPFDCYRAEDLPRLMRQPWSRTYRLFVFASVAYIDLEVRRAIRREVARDGRTLLWLHAAGLIAGGAFSPAAMTELTGIGVALRARGEPPLAYTLRHGARILYGTERLANPAIYGTGGDGEVQGWYLNSGDAALVQRRMPGWTSIWSGAPGLPSAVLRDVAREAGVHIYLDSGEQVLADGAVAGFHAAAAGERLVRFPGSVARLRDAFTLRTVAENVSEIRVHCERGRTYAWELS